MKKYFTIFIFLLLLLSGCYNQNDELTVNKTDYSLMIGESIELDFTMFSLDRVELINNNPEYFDIYQKTLTALEEGEGTITIKLDGNILETIITVKVLPLPSYSIISPQNLIIYEQSPIVLLYNDKQVSNVNWLISNEELAKMDAQGILTAYKLGSVRLDADLDGEIVASTVININLPNNYTLSFSTEDKASLGEIRILTASNNSLPLIWESSDESIATINAQGLVQFLKIGKVCITLSLKDEPSISYFQEIFVRGEDNISQKKIIVDEEINGNSDVIFYYDDIDYYKGINLFANLNQAIAASIEDSEIYLMPGNYYDDVIINKSNISIISANKNLNPEADNRFPEALIYGKIRLKNLVENFSINGLAFTQGSLITIEGQANKFSFLNNKIYDTNTTSVAWTEQATYPSGFLYFVGGGKNSEQIIIENNAFYNIGDIGIHFNNVNSFKVINNTFINFTKDAIRISNGITTKTGQWLFMKNTFQNGQYNGIYFRTYGSSSPFIENIISLFDNKFTNLGIISQEFSGAVSFRNYQEGLTSINISYNEFSNSKNYLYLRNNAKTQNQANFKAFVNYNLFISLPEGYYLKNKTSSDTNTTNPSNINMNNNLYLNSDNTPINLASYSNKFIGASSNTPLNDLTMLTLGPKVYGSNIIHLDSKPKMVASTGVTFTSSNLSIFTVNEEGEINPIKEGSATLFVKKGSYEISFPIFVTKSINIDYISLLLQIAIGEEGYKEGPNNDTKYGTWYGLPNQAWCAMFVSWSANQANIPTNIIPKYASVQIGMDWFKDHNQFKYKGEYIPKAGDLIFFKSDGASHTGIVIYSDGTYVYTIEGNTSDMVAKRSYPLTYSKITGYGLPEYPPYDGEAYVFDISGATSGAGHSTQ